MNLMLASFRLDKAITIFDEDRQSPHESFNQKIFRWVTIEGQRVT